MSWCYTQHLCDKVIFWTNCTILVPEVQASFATDFPHNVTALRGSTATLCCRVINRGTAAVSRLLYNRLTGTIFNRGAKSQKWSFIMLFWFTPWNDRRCHYFDTCPKYAPYAIISDLSSNCGPAVISLCALLYLLLQRNVIRLHVFYRFPMADLCLNTMLVPFSAGLYLPKG